MKQTIETLFRYVGGLLDDHLADGAYIQDEPELLARFIKTGLTTGELLTLEGCVLTLADLIAEAKTERNIKTIDLNEG